MPVVFSNISQKRVFLSGFLKKKGQSDHSPYEMLYYVGSINEITTRKKYLEQSEENSVSKTLTCTFA